MTDNNVEREINRLTRRGLITGGVAAALGAAGFTWIATGSEENGIPWQLRRVLRTNENLARGVLFSDNHKAPEFPVDQAVKEVRVNEDIGMSEGVDRDTWVVKTSGMSRPAVEVPLAEIKAMAKTEHVTEFKCVEGWSQIVHWGGTRFRDFAKAYPPAPGMNYVSMETPDGEYYVGLDLESAMHPQTLLTYEMSGEAITEEHGAPLRLCIPTKYGIKNIKQVGKIAYTAERPKDYWAERGYDWFAGL
jgi:DMSO/TMAO reductase YedYZ molybdopterin-dependent catalytic subunit